MTNRNGDTDGSRNPSPIDPRGTPEKNVYGTPKVNPGMTHQTDAGLARGISKTQSAQILGDDAIGDVTFSGGQLKAGHVAQNVPIHPGMTDQQHMQARTDNGPDVLAEAVLGARGNKGLPPANK